MGDENGAAWFVSHGWLCLLTSRRGGPVGAASTRSPCRPFSRSTVFQLGAQGRCALGLLGCSHGTQSRHPDGCFPDSERVLRVRGWRVEELGLDGIFK